MQAARPSRTGQATATILLVEDDRALVEVLAALLEAEGYRVRHAADAAAAGALFDEARPDLVILDLVLPDADGLVLLSDWRARWPGPIVRLSATRRERDRILGLRLGADAFIAKPFDAQELLARVDAVLRCAAASRRPTSPIRRSSPCAPSATNSRRAGGPGQDLRMGEHPSPAPGMLNTRMSGPERPCRSGIGTAVTSTSIHQQHAHHLLRLARVNAALSAWDEYEASALLPPDPRRPLPRPKLTRVVLKELQVMLVQRIGEPEELFERLLALASFLGVARMSALQMLSHMSRDCSSGASAEADAYRSA